MFLFIALGVVVLVSHSRCWKDPGEGFEKKKKKKAHRVQFKVRITKTVGSHQQLSVDSVTQARTYYIHLTNKLECTHAAAKKATHAQDRLWSHNRALLF